MLRGTAEYSLRHPRLVQSPDGQDECRSFHTHTGSRRKMEGWTPDVIVLNTEAWTLFHLAAAG